MKRVFLYILILASLLFVPLERVEIGKLKPVQGVCIYEENGEIILETDTNDRGIGGSVEEALRDMKQKSEGIIYLDTAQYLLVTGEENQIDALKQHLKGSVRVCKWSGNGDVLHAIRYADAHKIGIKLKDWQDDGNMPKLPI